MTPSSNLNQSGESEELRDYPRDKFADVGLAKQIKQILHPKGYEVLYPETEDELGNPKIQAIALLIHQRELDLLNSLKSALPERDNGAADAAYNGGADKNDYKIWGSNAMLSTVEAILNAKLDSLNRKEDHE